jgi:predicted metal-dependent peptidase
MLRRDGRDPVLWNIACDYAVNPIIMDLPGSSVILPEGCLFESKYAGTTAEAIYEDILTFSDDQLNRMKSMIMGQVDDYVQSNGDDEGELGTEGRDGYTLSPDEQKEKWRLIAAEAAIGGRLAGNLPGGLERIVGELISPRLPWREVLIRFITEKAKDDYTWSTASRRYLYAGMHLPSLSSPKLKDIGVIIDTSGSVSDEDVAGFASELASILSVCPGANAEVLYVDTQVAKHETLNQENLSSMRAHGGGGTDFRPGFEYFNEKSMDIACVVYFTDGECDRFPDDPGYETIWVIEGSNRSFNPPFGEVIFLID